MGVEPHRWLRAPKAPTRGTAVDARSLLARVASLSRRPCRGAQDPGTPDHRHRECDGPSNGWDEQRPAHRPGQDQAEREGIERQQGRNIQSFLAAGEHAASVTRVQPGLGAPTSASPPLRRSVCSPAESVTLNGWPRARARSAARAIRIDTDDPETDQAWQSGCEVQLGVTPVHAVSHRPPAQHLPPGAPPSWCGCRMHSSAAQRPSAHAARLIASGGC